MQPARQGRRLRVPLAYSKGARRETDNECRCDAEPAGAGDPQTGGRRDAGGDVPGDAQAGASRPPWSGHHRGIDPNSQVDELAWGLVAEGMSGKTEGTGSTDVPTGEEVVGVALGTYNPNSTEAYFKQQKLPSFKARGYTLFAFGTGSGANDLFFFFLDSNTAAFGHRAVLEKMIEVRFGSEEGLIRNDTLFALINEANGSGVVWAVLNPAYTRLAMQQLAPEVQQFPEAAKLVARMQNMIINVDASSGLDGKFQAVCGSTDDANTLGQLLQAAFLYKRYHAAGVAQRRPDDLADSKKYLRAKDVESGSNFMQEERAGRCAVRLFFVSSDAYPLGAAWPIYLVRRVTSSPFRVPYWVRSKPAKTRRGDPVPPVPGTNTAVLRPSTGRPSPRGASDTSMRSDKRVKVTSSLG